MAMGVVVGMTLPMEIDEQSIDDQNLRLGMTPSERLNWRRRESPVTKSYQE